MVQIKISHQIEFDPKEIPFELYTAIKKDLVYTNPDYTQAIKQGRRTHGIPDKIILYRYNGLDNLVLPRGYGKQLIQRFQEHKVNFNYEDNRLTLPSVEFGSKIKLRDYQEEAVQELTKHKQGGVVAGCGAGKTMIMLETMARLKQPSLWITHTHELLEQAIERACGVLDIKKEEIGVIGGGNFSVGPRLTVALVQTLSKADLSEIADKFGAVFIDEGHHISARSFFHPIGQFPSHIRIWASATIERADGLTEMVFAGAGPVLHTVDQSKVPTITPQLEVVKTSFWSNEDNYVNLINQLINDHKRNDLIVKTIASQARGNYSLVLSERLEHLEILQGLLVKELPDLSIKVLNGKMNKKERSEVMDLVRNKQVDILLATQLAREGLDIPFLNRLFLCCPKKAGGAVEQECGRIMRPSPEKDSAVVFDFVDFETGILKSQFWKRREVYRKIGMDWPPKQNKAVQ